MEKWIILSLLLVLVGCFGALYLIFNHLDAVVLDSITTSLGEYNVESYLNLYIPISCYNMGYRYDCGVV